MSIITPAAPNHFTPAIATYNSPCLDCVVLVVETIKNCVYAIFAAIAAGLKAVLNAFTSCCSSTPSQGQIQARTYTPQRTPIPAQTILFGRTYGGGAPRTIATTRPPAITVSAATTACVPTSRPAQINYPNVNADHMKAVIEDYRFTLHEKLRLSAEELQAANTLLTPAIAAEVGGRRPHDLLLAQHESALQTHMSNFDTIRPADVTRRNQLLAEIAAARNAVQNFNALLPAHIRTEVDRIAALEAKMNKNTQYLQNFKDNFDPVTDATWIPTLSTLIIHTLVVKNANLTLLPPYLQNELFSRVARRVVYSPFLLRTLQNDFFRLSPEDQRVIALADIENAINPQLFSDSGRTNTLDVWNRLRDIGNHMHQGGGRAIGWGGTYSGGPFSQALEQYYMAHYAAQFPPTA